MGFNLPPGCSVRDLPGEQPVPPCDMCGGWVDGDEPECICPECDVCGEYGNPECYQRHGLRRSLDQEAQLAEQQAKWAQENEAVAILEAYMPEYDKDDTPILKLIDRTPIEIKTAIADAQTRLHVLSRAFSAGIQPIHTARQLVAIANAILNTTEKWQPPTSP